MTNDTISRQAAIDAVYAEFEYVYCYNCDHEENEEWCEGCHRKYMKWSASRNTIERVLKGLPSAQPEVKPISYINCANAMLKMWIDGVLTDGEYNRIMDKLNAKQKQKGKSNE